MKLKQMKTVSKELIIETIEQTENLAFPTQKKLCIPIIERIYKKMMYGIKFDDIKTCDHLIIDGHHRYVSSLLANSEVGIALSSRTSATTEYTWKDVEFVEEEWDTQEKIQRLNEQDAEFNKLDIKKLIEMLK